MKNKFNETGSEFGNQQSMPKSKYKFSDINNYSNEQELDLTQMKYPIETREILIQLLGTISSKIFRNRLLKEIDKLDEIIASKSNILKGDAIIDSEQIKNKCMYTLPNGKKCGKQTRTYKYICDEHGEEQEIKPYGRYCEECGIDTFNELHHQKKCGYFMIEEDMQEWANISDSFSLSKNLKGGQI
jgi:hypothetical protein